MPNMLKKKKNPQCQQGVTLGLDFHQETNESPKEGLFTETPKKAFRDCIKMITSATPFKEDINSHLFNGFMGGY